MRGRRPSKKDSAPRVLTAEETRARTFQRAAKLLAAKPRSIAELRERLLAGTQVNEAAVAEVLDRLKEYGYLDDERFAFSYASLKVKQRPLGRQRLARDLKFKQVNSAVADEALNLVYAETSENELIDRAIEKRVRVRGRSQDRAAAAKLFEHLLRLGFDLELVREKVRALTKEELD